MPVHYDGPPLIGYCTNVHAGADWAETRANLDRHAVRIRESLGIPELGLGLWLSAAAAREILAADRVAALRDWLAERGLRVFTLNGFPYGDFHQPIVKHAVYEPDWSTPQRAGYTRDLAEILCGLVPEGVEGSISTLPVGWKASGTSAVITASADHLLQVADFLRQLEQSRGRLIHLDLEPEPGCRLECSTDVVRFFTESLAPRADEFTLRRHLRVCHDICHAAVMFEDQHEALRNYARAGIAVGKVQVSAALRVPFQDFHPERQAAALAALADFAEQRYLHQTLIRLTSGEPPRFFEDLSAAIAAARFDPQLLAAEWRIHFHVPIYLSGLGMFRTTQPDTLACLAALGQDPVPHHFEIETYAWNVLPSAFRAPELSAGIAREIAWLQSVAPWM